MVRLQEAHVIEVLKSDSLGVPPRVSFYQPGGSLFVAGRQVNTKFDSDLLKPGDEAILFLVRDTRSTGEFWIAFGPSGMVQIKEFSGNQSAAVIPAHFSEMAEFGGRKSLPKDDFLSRLRTLRGTYIKLGHRPSPKALG